MTNVERPQGESIPDIVELLALFYVGRIQKRDLDDRNRAILEMCISWMPDDPQLAKKVHFRENQLLAGGGSINPLYTPEELEPASHHRPNKIIRQPGLQPSLFPVETTTSHYEIDPEKRMHTFGKSLDRRHTVRPRDVLTEEISHKKQELREMIGLPIARGKDPHVNDRMYQFLVRRVCSWDKFGIFNEYDRALDSQNLPEILITRIEQVKTFIGEFLNGKLNLRQQYNLYNEFLDQYNNQWFSDK